MTYVFNNDTPIYLQIVDLIINDIINGSLKPNDKLLSVREYSNVFKVNPNTIVKALAMLEDDKLIYTDGTAYAVSLRDSKVLKKAGVNCEELYVLLRTDAPAQENAVITANNLIK